MGANISYSHPPHTLQTARTINGTSFNGSANITTSKWGTARTITIGNKGKSVDGSGNVAWSLSEIGGLDRVLKYLGWMGDNYSANLDWNTLINTWGFYTLTHPKNPKNAPWQEITNKSISSRGCLLILGMKADTYHVYFASNNVICWRCQIDTTWSKWRWINDTVGS